MTAMRTQRRQGGDVGGMEEGELYPNDGESYEEFMSRCGDQVGDLNVCQLIWDDDAAEDDMAMSGTTGICHKTHTGQVNGREFVLSDETPDRLQDIILADGWDIGNFQKNPIALFNHNSNAPIGKWTNVRVVDKQLRGHLELAPAGTSDRIDEIRKLIDAGILRAVSVGFRPKGSKPRPESDGMYFTKAELIETSLVSVPANPNALAVAKSLQISPATIDVVFAGKGKDNGMRRRGLTGGQARNSSDTGKGTTMSYAQRITAAEQRLNGLRDQLNDHWAKTDDANVSDDQLTTADELKNRIAIEERTLAGLRDAERHLAATSDDSGGNSHALVVRAPTPAVPARQISASRPFSAPPRKQLSAIDHMVRAGTVQLLAHRDRVSCAEKMREIYGDDEATRAMLEYSARAASTIATTTQTGWAAELAQTLFTAFMEVLYPKAVFPRLAMKGLSLSFGTAGKISIPTRATTPTIAGSFVGEGLPIPVRQGLFTSQILTPKKMAVITTWTRELSEHSVPAIEGLLRDGVQEDTAISLDSVLLDANPATTVRPAGILNGVSGLTPTAGGGFAALTGDIKAISGALLTGTKGNVRNPVWLMNPQQINSALYVAAPGAGVFPYRSEIQAGQLGGWPVIDSGTVPLGTVIAIDAADFVAVGGDAPRFEISDQATLHMEDTTPLDIGTVGAPATVAAPVKSMWQTDSLALRLILPINWTIRRAGVVAWSAGVTW
jgi:HK97 family phage prohead protease/HK97 family phage major capsid protein